VTTHTHAPATGPLRGLADLVAGLAVVAVALALPAPKSPTRPGVATGPAPSTAAGGGATMIADIWPQAKPVAVSATQPDGRKFTPLLVLDRDTTLGRLTSDETVARELVLRTPTGMRALQSGGALDTTDVVATASTSSALFWMRVTADSGGNGRYSIWSANLDGTAVRTVTTDVGSFAPYDAEYDLQVADGRLYWVAARNPTTRAVDLRSVPITGGPVSRQPLEGGIAMSAWPWAVTASTNPGGGADLTNVVTGARRHATAGFVVIAAAGQTTLNGVNTRLSLYDLTTNRTILVSPAATDAGSRNGYLWWSDGVGESLTWHIFDLHNLP
jgi:hypothetical protein